MEDQNNNKQNTDKGYTPESENNQKNNESQEPTQNLKWDQAQRRQQAGPRSYNESVDSENKFNQNTEADNEQIDEDWDNPNDPKKIGDQISERQQTVDEKNRPRDQNDKTRKD